MVFQVTQVVYKSNLYRDSAAYEKFIYAQFPVYDIVVKQEDAVDGKTSLFNITETPIVVPFAVDKDLKVSAEQRPQCIQRLPAAGGAPETWSGQHCVLREANEGQQQQILCKCKFLAETTLVYTDSSVLLVHHIVVMDVKESVLFWILIAQTGLWVLVLPWALLKDTADQERWAKILALDESETRERGNSNEFKP